MDPRRSFRNAVATDGELLRLARRERAVEEPRLVVLCDTSGSMDRHMRFLLTFLLSLKKAARRTELFAFNTSLVRLTPWVSPAKIAATLERLAAGVPGWSGGTQIGRSLGEFVDRYLDEMVDARTVVVIVSDGLDRGDTAVLVAAMRAITARARRVDLAESAAGRSAIRADGPGDGGRAAVRRRLRLRRTTWSPSNGSFRGLSAA